MDVLYSGLFWGAFLMLIGVLLAVRMVFRFGIPVFRLLVIGALLWGGLTLLLGRPFNPKDATMLFGRSEVSAAMLPGDWSIVFGSGTIDLTSLPPEPGEARKLTVVFGKGTLVVDPDAPLEVGGNAFFSRVRLPAGRSTAFGAYRYRTPAAERDGRAGAVKANAVFGELAVREAGPAPHAGGTKRAP